FDPDTNSYDNSTWSYQTDENGAPLTDPSLEDPNTVFQILARHYSRYTPEVVADSCGIKPADFDYLYESVTQNSGRERTTCFAYAVGWTQHCLGAQFIRTASILQLLLGNMGRPGGGIMALRGHATIQGRPISRPCSTCCPATCRCPAQVSTTASTTTSPPSAPRRPTRATGPTAAPMPRTCSRPGGVMRRTRTTTSPSTICRGSTAPTAPTRHRRGCSPTASTATSCSGRTRPWVRPTGGCSGWR